MDYVRCIQIVLHISQSLELFGQTIKFTPSNILWRTGSWSRISSTLDHLHPQSPERSSFVYTCCRYKRHVFDRLLLGNSWLSSLQVSIALRHRGLNRMADILLTTNFANRPILHNNPNAMLITKFSNFKDMLTTLACSATLGYTNNCISFADFVVISPVQSWRKHSLCRHHWHGSYIPVKVTLDTAGNNPIEFQW